MSDQLRYRRDLWSDNMFIPIYVFIHTIFNIIMMALYDNICLNMQIT